MRNKIPILVALGLCALIPTGYVIAADDPAALLKQADAYRDNQQHTNALRIYQSILANSPKDPCAIWAQAGLVVCNICLKDEKAADAAFKELLAKYRNQPDFSRVVCDIGDQCRWRNVDERARDIYLVAVAVTPAPDAILPQMGLAITSIRLADYATADPLAQKLTSDYAGDARLPKAACLIADAYRAKRKHQQAADLYQHVLDKYPDSEYAMWSQMGIAISDIDVRNYDAAKSAADELCAKYKDHPSFYQAARIIGDEYRWRNQHDKARPMFEIALQGLSGDQAFWPTAGLAIAAVRTGDPNRAEELTRKLSSEYAAHAGLAEATCLIADAYRTVSNQDRATTLYQHILDTWPGSNSFLWARAGLARVAISRGDDVAAQVVFDGLVKDFPDHPVTPDAIMAIGEGYYEKALFEERRPRKGSGAKSTAQIAMSVAPDSVRGDYEKAIEKFEFLIQNLPPTSSATPKAYHFAAESYRKMRQYEKMVQWTDALVADWPDYEFASLMLLRIGQTYGNLVAVGILTEAQADRIIRSACQQVLQRYPGSPAARPAREWLTWNANSEEGEEQ